MPPVRPMTLPPSNMCFESIETAPLVEVVIEIPRGSFMKRGSSGELDFVSPVPCPFNYGSIHGLVAADDDWLDALVLGPRLAARTRVTLPAYAAIGFTDRDIYDDKLICAATPLSAWQKSVVLGFFHLYALSKSCLNAYRHRDGRTACDGWGSAREAMARTSRHPAISYGQRAPF